MTKEIARSPFKWLFLAVEHGFEWVRGHYKELLH